MGKNGLERSSIGYFLLKPIGKGMMYFFEKLAEREKIKISKLAFMLVEVIGVEIKHYGGWSTI